MFDSFDDVLAFNEKVESSGGGEALIGDVSYQVGWKAFVSGMGDDTSFFPVTSKEEYTTQKAACEAFIAKHAPGRKPNYGYLLTLYKDGVLSKDASGWKGDLSGFTSDWTSASKEIVVPSLKEMNEKPGVRFYARIGRNDDPYKVGLGDAGKTDTDNNGNARFPTVLYFAEKFDSKEAALAACGDNGKVPQASAPKASPLSDKAKENGWTMDTLVATRKTIESEVAELVGGGKPLPLARAEVAKTYALEVDDIVVLDSTPF